MSLDLKCSNCVPRIRGDDPGYKSCTTTYVDVFPASAGMILGRGAYHLGYVGVPRIRGDDPHDGLCLDVGVGCSPYPRG